jgi:hypothetical protein
MPMKKRRETKPAGASVRQTTRQRVFLTFAAGDLALARPVTARLVAGGGLSLDQAFTSEPFQGERGDFIRASLLTRLRHCTSALCLYGARISDDEWARWALEVAAEVRLPLLGAALPAGQTWESEHYLTRLGADIVPLDRDLIIAKATSVANRPRMHVRDAASIVETLHLMRHPLR